MALQALEGAGGWFPLAPSGNDILELGTTYVIDAAGEVAVMVLRCPRAGDLDRFDAYVHTVTNSPDNGLRFSLQGVDATGVQDGVILGATNNAFVTYAHTVTTGWKATNFAEVATVARNQLIACVVDIPSFTASDSIAMRSVRNVNSNNRFPYGISATNTRQTGESQLLIGLHYTDGYYSYHPYIPTFESAASAIYSSGTGTADEWGMGFQIPFPAKLNQVMVQLSAAAAADFEVLVYDSGGTVVATLTHDGDVGSATSLGPWYFFTQTELTLAANSTYRVTIRPTSANNVAIRYWVFNSAAHMNTIGGGDNWYMTSQLDQAGSWTDYNASSPGFRRPLIFLQFSAFDDGASGGGGGRPEFRGSNL